MELEPETGCFQFEKVPNALTGVLDRPRFCGPACARAFILEALELLDAAPPSAALRDVEDMRVAFRFLLVLMAIQGTTSGPFGPASAPWLVERAERDS